MTDVNHLYTAATLAGLSYEQPKKFENGAEQDVKIMSTLNDLGQVYIAAESDSLTGFGATAFRNEATGEVTIAFAGTDLKQIGDSVQDILLFTVGSGIQNQQAVEFTKSIIEKYPDANITLAGHSLGGHLAQSVAMQIDEVDNVVTINTAGVGDAGGGGGSGWLNDNELTGGNAGYDCRAANDNYNLNIRKIA